MSEFLPDGALEWPAYVWRRRSSTRARSGGTASGTSCRCSTSSTARTSRPTACTAPTSTTARARRAGEQVFEDYGQPNHIYYLYHGFAMAENSYDCVRFDLAVEQGDAGAADVGALRRRLGAGGFRA